VYVRPVKLHALIPPHDDLLAAIFHSDLRLREGDVLAVASKVVSIHEGLCLPVEANDKKALARKESSLFLPNARAAGRNVFHTIARGVLIRNAGIDESNGKGHYILWPKNPDASASRLRRALKLHFRLKHLGVIITDSTSTPLRRGAIGFALGYSGFQPLYDYRGLPDIFGRRLKMEQANLADALAAAAVLVMGEGNEQTPLAVIREVPKTIWQGRRTRRGWSEFRVSLKDDIFAPFWRRVRWKKGGE